MASLTQKGASFGAQSRHVLSNVRRGDGDRVCARHSGAGVGALDRLDLVLHLGVRVHWDQVGVGRANVVARRTLLLAARGRNRLAATAPHRLLPCTAGEQRNAATRVSLARKQGKSRACGH